MFASDGDSDPTDDIVGTPLATCTTDSTGFCGFEGLNPGDYWVVDLSVPGGYCTASPAFQHVTLGFTNQSVSFVDPRLFTVITLVCRASDNRLYPSTVTLDGQTETSLAPGALTAAQQAALCGLGGARFENRTAQTHTGQVVIDSSSFTGPLVCEPEICDDAVDNDGDLQVDCDDLDCSGDSACP